MSTKTAIGEKVKALRTGRKMTIKQVSEASGLSIGFLSQFERGISSIAIDSLETIANVLGVPVSELFTGIGEENRAEKEPEDAVMHGVELVPDEVSPKIYQSILKHPVPVSELFTGIGEENRAEKEPEDAVMHGVELVPDEVSPKIYQSILKHPHTDFDMLPRVYTLLPMLEKEENAEMYSHNGEEFLYVLEGVITLYLDDRKYVMYPGDSIHFDSHVKHNWMNRTAQIARILTVNSPNPLKKKG